MAANGATLTALILPTVYVTLTLISIGGVFERRGWVVWGELIRLGLLVVLAGVFSVGTAWIWPALVASISLAIGSALYVWLRRRELLEAPFEQACLAPSARP
jgi:hypothetical protein